MTILFECKPTKIDICIVRDADYVLSFQLTDKQGRAFDISGDNVYFSVREGYAGNAMISESSLAGSHLLASQGIVEFTLSQADLNAATSERCQSCLYYEIRREPFPVGSEAIHICGKLIVDPAVTRI